MKCLQKVGDVSVTEPLNCGRLKLKLRDLGQGSESDEVMIASWKCEMGKYTALATRFLGMPCSLLRHIGLLFLAFSLAR